MDKSQKHYAELKKPDTKSICCIISFTWSSKPAKLIFVDKYQINSCLWGAVDTDQMQHGGTFWSDKNVLYLDFWGVVTEVYAPGTTDLTAYLKWVHFIIYR